MTAFFPGLPVKGGQGICIIFISRPTNRIPFQTLQVYYLLHFYLIFPCSSYFRFVLFCFFVGFVFDIILFKYIFYNVFNMILNIFKCYIMQVSCFINFDHNVYREYITYITVTNEAYRYMYIL